jgi:hypothetical protein
MSHVDDLVDDDAFPCPLCGAALNPMQLGEHLGACQRAEWQRRRDRLAHLPDAICDLLRPEPLYDSLPVVDEICAGLYLGSRSVLDAAAHLRPRAIRHVVNCAREIPPPADELRAADATCTHLPIDDSARFDIAPFLSQGADAIAAHLQLAQKSTSPSLSAASADGECGGSSDAPAPSSVASPAPPVHEQRSVVVHCAMGVSRSASVVIAFLIRHRGMSLVDALALVRARRFVAYPNKGFLRSLRAFESQCRGGAHSSLPEEAMQLHKDFSA